MDKEVSSSSSFFFCIPSYICGFTILGEIFAMWLFLIQP